MFRKASAKPKGGYCAIFVAPSSLFVGCIVGLDVFHTSEYCFSHTLITSPERDKPDGNYLMAYACVRFLFTGSEVAEDE